MDGTDGFGGIVFPPFNAVRMDAQILHGTATLGEGLLLLQTHQRAAILEESRLNASASAWRVITLLSRASEMILLPCDQMALIEAGVSDGAVLHGADDVLGSRVIREVDEVFPATELERARSWSPQGLQPFFVRGVGLSCLLPDGAGLSLSGVVGVPQRVESLVVGELLPEGTDSLFVLRCSVSSVSHSQ